MAVEIDGKVYRNLPEQVLANQKDIEDIIKDKSKMVTNISLNDSTYAPSDGTITLPGLVTTGTEQTVSAKKNFTELNADNAKFTNLEITDELVYSGSSALKLKGVQPTLTRHYVSLKDVANNQFISATFIFRKSAKFTSMDDFFNTLVGEYGFSPSNLPFFGAGVIYTLTFIAPTIISAYGFNMATASAIVNPNITFLNDVVSTMGHRN